MRRRQLTQRPVSSCGRCSPRRRRSRASPLHQAPAPSGGAGSAARAEGGGAVEWGVSRVVVHGSPWPGRGAAGRAEGRRHAPCSGSRAPGQQGWPACCRWQCGACLWGARGRVGGGGGGAGHGRFQGTGGRRPCTCRPSPLTPAPTHALPRRVAPPAQPTHRHSNLPSAGGNDGGGRVSDRGVRRAVGRGAIARRGARRARSAEEREGPRRRGIRAGGHRPGPADGGQCCGRRGGFGWGWECRRQ